MLIILLILVVLFPDLFRLIIAVLVLYLLLH